MSARAGLLARVALAAGFAAAGITAAAPAAQQDGAGPSWSREVRPLLDRSCAGCHRPGKTKGRLDLSSHASLSAGGRSGAVVVPGEPEQSLLLELVHSHDGEPPEMPEEGEPLAAAEVALLVAWVRAGALEDAPPEDAAAGAPALPIYPRPPVITALAFAPDGRFLAVGGQREVLLLDAQGGARASYAPSARWVGAPERIESLAWSPDGARLAVVGGAPGRRGELQVWDVARGARELVLSRGGEIPFSDSLFGVSWSPDGRSLAFGATDAARVVDARTGELRLFSAAHEDWVLDTTFTRDGSHLVTVSRDRSMKLVKVETQQFIDNITSITPGALKGGLMAVAGHPARDELLVGGADGTPKVYRTFREQKRVIGDDYNLLRAFEPLPGRVFDVAWGGRGGPGGPDGAAEWVVACASATGYDAHGELRCWSAADGARRWTFSTPQGLYALSVAHDGSAVAAGGFEGRLFVVAGDDGRALYDGIPFPLEPPPGAGAER